jgi:predicted nucleic acid-binding protein
MIVVIDSNFLISLAFEDNLNHRRALDLWNDVEKAYLPVVAAMEVAYFLLKYKMRIRLLEEMLRDEKIEVAESTISDLMFAISKMDRIKSYDDFNDMMIVGTSTRLSLKLLSFDREMTK